MDDSHADEGSGCTHGELIYERLLIARQSIHNLQQPVRDADTNACKSNFDPAGNRPLWASAQLCLLSV